MRMFLEWLASINPVHRETVDELVDTQVELDHAERAVEIAEHNRDLFEELLGDSNVRIRGLENELAQYKSDEKRRELVFANEQLQGGMKELKAKQQKAISVLRGAGESVMQGDPNYYTRTVQALEILRNG